MEYRLIAPRQSGVTLLEQILLNRGIKKEDIEHYLTVNQNDDLNPELLDNIRSGLELIIKHAALNSNVLVIIDSDCDGYCASAILLNYLNRQFPGWVQNHFFYQTHDGKQHGLNDLDISDCLVKQIQLIIVPDAGTSDYIEHQELSKRKIDCLVIDHHQADKGYSFDAVVINNQLSKQYPTKSLCGGAMVYKFCKYFDKIAQTNYAYDFLDLVALSLVSDMMDTRDFETHYLITEGLQRINNPFFVEMMNRQSYQFDNNGITPIGIAFYIVPYINAITRSGTMEEKMLIFEAMLEWRSNETIPSTKRGCKGQVESRHEQAGRTCINVKSRQKKVQDEGLTYIENLIEEQHLLDNKLLIVRVPQKDVDKNLAGLIANQLASKYQRPTLVLRIFEDDDGIITYSGSGRNYGKSRLEDFRQFCLNTNMVVFAQGHASAFGLSIQDKNFDQFIEITNKELADFDFKPCYTVDLEVEGNQLTEQDVFSIASNNELWGQEMEEPLIAIINLQITPEDVSLLGSNKNTLKINLPAKNLNMIKFNIKEEDKEILNIKTGKIIITAIGKCALNHFNGNTYSQILLEDFEINKVIKWDF